MRQVVRFGDPSTGREGANLGSAIVTNGAFTAYVCDSAATRPSSQITLGRLVTNYYCCYYFSVVYAVQKFNVRLAQVR